MPELAEVEWFRKQWDAGRGHEVVDLTMHEENRVFRETDVGAIRDNLVGQRFLSSHRHGKWMLFKFSGDNWLGVHLGMTGKVHVAPRDYRPTKRDHFVLFQKDRSLVFSDYRQFGRVRFHHGRDEPGWWKSEAPEIDSPDFDQEYFNAFLNRHRKAPIKAALLMQNGFPGIGNWMADEILWRAKVPPAKRIRRLTAQDRHQLFRATKFVVRRSLETLGKDFSDPPRNWLIHQKWKRGGICPIHRTPLRHAAVAGRTTAWCPRCQK